MFEIENMFELVEENRCDKMYRMKTKNGKEFFLEENKCGTINMGAVASEITDAVDCLNCSGYRLTEPTVGDDCDTIWSGRHIIYIRFQIIEQDKIKKALQEKIFENKINNVKDAREMVKLAVEKGHFCEHVYKYIYDLTQQEQYKEVYSNLICGYTGNEEKEAFNVVGCDWGEKKDKKVYNLLHIEDLIEMKQKGYIITNFGCDDHLCYFTREQFKKFVEEYYFM